MSDTPLRTELDEPEVIALLLRRKVVTESQLKAALDFQKSVGGHVLDILHNLGLVRSSKLEEVLEKAEDSCADDTRESLQVIKPDAVSADDLKLHHRLLDKVPADIVEEYLIVLLFPVPELCARKLIVGHGRDVPDGVLDRIHKLLGVEICSLSLQQRTAYAFLRDYVERQGAKRALNLDFGAVPAVEEEGPTADESREESAADCGAETASREIKLLKALVGVLVKKGLITAEELQVELEIGRH